MAVWVKVCDADSARATVPAPYERRAEDKVADGQQSFAFDENGEIQE